MDFGGKFIEDYFKGLKRLRTGTFPHDENFIVKYNYYAQEFYKWIHSDVAVGSMYADYKKFGNITFLTNHGTDHIKTVMKYAGELCGSGYIRLSPFEIYMLLMCIHVHDVGNILGRKGHEYNALEIIRLFDTGVVNQNKLVWDFIYQIAKAHKGEEIEMLPAEEHLFGVLFRPQLLAAILKFADELAENFSRSSAVNVELKNMPAESVLYHLYAQSVNTIRINHETRQVLMTYFFNEEHLHEKFVNDGSEEYLVDYIYQRTLKTYSERIYCMKYLRPLINIDSIKVTINIMKADRSIYKNGYELTERGIENINMTEVLSYCPSLTDFTGVNLCSLSLSDQLK